MAVAAAGRATPERLSAIRFAGRSSIDRRPCRILLSPARAAAATAL